MTIQQNTDRIQTTHIGSLPRPHDRARPDEGEARRQALRRASSMPTRIARRSPDSVRKQVECGIDIVTDGEFSKPGFFTYIQERLDGFEPRPKQKLLLFQQEVAAFPEYYAQYFKEAMMGGAIVPMSPVVCVGPVKYRGEKLVQIDIANVKAAAKAAGVAEPSRVPAGDRAVGRRHQRVLQDPTKSISTRSPPSWARNTRRSSTPASWCRSTIRSCPTSSSSPASTTRRRSGAPRSTSRRPTRRSRAFRPRWCASTPATASTKARASTKRPRRHHRLHAARSTPAPTASKPPTRATSTSTTCSSASRCRTARCCAPASITHASNIVEHPELIAERILRFAKLVGRENVMARADCGFSSQALYKTEVHHTVVWEKFKAMRQGADIASKQLWH